MRSTVTFASLLLLLAIFPGVDAGASTRGREYVNPKLKSKERPVRTAVILPAQMELTRLGMKGTEGMTKESEALAEALTGMLVKQLRDRGVDVLASPFTEEALKQNEDLRAAVARVQAKYDGLSTQLHKKPKDVAKGRFTLGDEVADLVPAARADTLVFVRGRGTVLTGGKKAFGILVAGAKSSSLRCYVTLVDSKSGEVLSLVDLMTLGEYLEKPEKAMEKPMTKCFKKIPLGGGK